MARGLLAVLLLLVSCDGIGRFGEGRQQASPYPVTPWEGEVDALDAAMEVDLASDVLPEMLDTQGDHRDLPEILDVPLEMVDLRDLVELDRVEETLDVLPDEVTELPPPCECLADVDCGVDPEAPCYIQRCELPLESDDCGVCVRESAPPCPEAPVCSQSHCVAALGCVLLPDGEADPCDDGNLCTGGDSCHGGVCVGSLIVCDDDNPCTWGICDPSSGDCTQLALSLPCDDGNACTVDDRCALGVCEGSIPLVCQDNESCTVDSCDAATGCVHEWIPGCCHNAGDCDDQDYCTLESCEGGWCKFKPANCDDGLICTEDTCEALSGCLHSPVPGCCTSATDCADGDPCTVESCVLNACQHSPLECEDANPCTENKCQAPWGCLFPVIPGCCLGDFDCDDGSLCTLDFCSNHTCETVALDCDDQDPCTVDLCNATQGCLNQGIPGCCVSSSQCNDLDPCTSDACVSNSCIHTPIASPECCVPDCTGKECGPDGCGGLCAECLDGYCGEDFQCHVVCVPDCAGKECGPDGCGTYCGLCDDGQVCAEPGQCVQCQPNCDFRECGDDGCGGSCGFCGVGEACQSDIGVCMPACVCSGEACYHDGFETGTLGGWSYEGDVYVTHNMGIEGAVEGWYMVAVGSGLSDLELGRIEKTFCPPAGTRYLSFHWKYYSEEFVEWCGSQYQDSFEVKLTNALGQHQVLWRTVDDLCKPGSCSHCGDFYVGLEPSEVVYDQGDVYTTPWQTAVYELPQGYAAYPITVTIQVYDVGDSQYTSAVLIDNVYFFSLPTN